MGRHVWYCKQPMQQVICAFLHGHPAGTSRCAVRDHWCWAVGATGWEKRLQWKGHTNKKTGLNSYHTLLLKPLVLRVIYIYHTILHWVTKILSVTESPFTLSVPLEKSISKINKPNQKMQIVSHLTLLLVCPNHNNTNQKN
jgi:hypothetical protein